MDIPPSRKPPNPAALDRSCILVDDLWKRIMLLLLTTLPYAAPILYGYRCSQVSKKWNKIACTTPELWEFTLGEDPESWIGIEYEKIIISPSVILGTPIPCDCIFKSISLLTFHDDLISSCNGSVSVGMFEDLDPDPLKIRNVSMALIKEMKISDKISTTRNSLLFWRYMETSDASGKGFYYNSETHQNSAIKPTGFGQVSIEDAQTITPSEHFTLHEGFYVGVNYDSSNPPATPYRRPKNSRQFRFIYHKKTDQPSFFRLRIGGCGWYVVRSLP